MKKLISILTLLCILLLNINTKAYVAKKIDLKLKNDETSIVFLRLENSMSLLITDEDDSNLFIIDYKNDKGLKNAIKIFGNMPDIFYLNKKIDKKIDNTHIFMQNNILKFRINNYTICIIRKNKNSINSCNFVYLMKLDSEFEVNEKISAIFYDISIPKLYLNNIQESWVDSAIVSPENFTILKLNEDSYNILVVPSTNS